tara:strand:+ start:284 stop:994 length:711 start_codon:yes stop_codon:yes gene_type:complete
MNDNEEDLFPELVEAPPEPEYDIPDEHIESEEEDVPDDPLIPDIKPREKIEQQDIFIEQKSKKNVKVVIEDKVEEEIPSIVAVKPDVKPAKKKRVMSEEHKAKLAVARQKAMITRKANAAKRKEEKELEKEEKQLSTTMRRKRVEKMKQIVSDKPVVMKKPEVVEKVVEKQVGYTEEQLHSAIAMALEVEDKKRKVRKSKKLEIKKEQESKKKIFNTINNAVTGNPELDQWSHCFN